MGTIALDTETTGLDLYHGCKPFFVSIYEADTDMIHWWEWDVDPLTRDVMYKQDDLDEIIEWLCKSDLMVLQNSQFDFQALRQISPDYCKRVDKHWDWGKVEDTLIAGHLLASNEPHNLTHMTREYVGENIQPLEDDLRKCCIKARNVAKSKTKNWMTANSGNPMLPSAKGKNKTTARGAEDESPWKCDCWLPRQLAVHLKYPESHEWHTVLRKYANTDTPATYEVWRKQKKIIKERGLEKHFYNRMNLPRIVASMEIRGIPMIEANLKAQEARFREEMETSKKVCVDVACELGYDLVLPKGSMNHSLRDFCFGASEYRTLLGDETYTTRFLDLPVISRGKKSGAPSLKSGSLKTYVSMFPEDDPKHRFSKALLEKRGRGTAISYMESYRRFWHPHAEHPGYYVVHPQLRATGSNTIRFTSSNPNEQNVSKKKQYNQRFCFGPPPGWEMWTFDYENLELRIPAYAAPEPAMIELFESPDKPPFFGSYHMLVFSILHEKEWQNALDEYGETGAAEFCKEYYASTLYQWTKNGNFAVQYGAVAESGTADRAYHVEGGQAMIEGRFTNIKKLSKHHISHAEEFGLIYTMPRKSVDPTKGYPLLCTKTEWGRILPTVPLSYFVQGTAMECTTGAMERVDEFLNDLNRKRKIKGHGYHISMQVHDELGCLFPKTNNKGGNLSIANEVVRLMELSGDDIGVPLKVKKSYHPHNWSESEKYNPL